MGSAESTVIFVSIPRTFVIILLCCFLLSGRGVVTGQTPPPQSSEKGNSSFVIKTSARIVLLDVLVTDIAGKPIHGLKARDFTVLEDRKPQKLRGFEERGPDIGTVRYPAAPKLPPDTYTNYLATPETGAITILLFDSLNTDAQSLVTARQQLLRYLRGLHDNTRIALFALDWELHLIHGFTDDPRELIEAAQQLSSSPHPMYSNARGVSEALAEAKEAGVDKSPKMYEALARFLWEDLEGKEESRTIVTLEALNKLARNMAVFSGRKNLIWISGGLPFDPASTAPQIERTASLLAATQMAVYPIDARGLSFPGADAATRSTEIYAPAQTQDYETLSGQGEEILTVRETMTSLADLTGGHAYYNRNDLQSAIKESVESGSNYYTLAYRPENENWNGKFRKITVNVSIPKVKVNCRRGYFAVPNPLGSPDIDRTFSLAMQPTAPVSTSLIIKARLLPPQQPGTPALIDFLTDVHDLSLTDTSDHRRAPDVLFVAAARDLKGKPNGTVSATYRQALRPAELESLMRTGLQLRQEMMLMPGTYLLRLGVVDRLSGKIGTLDIPLTIESKDAK